MPQTTTGLEMLSVISVLFDEHGILLQVIKIYYGY